MCERLKQCGNHSAKATAKVDGDGVIHHQPPCVYLCVFAGDLHPFKLNSDTPTKHKIDRIKPATTLTSGLNMRLHFMHMFMFTCRWKNVYIIHILYMYTRQLTLFARSERYTYHGRKIKFRFQQCANRIKSRLLINKMANGNIKRF